jgi:hypothetical protein
MITDVSSGFNRWRFFIQGINIWQELMAYENKIPKIPSSLEKIFKHLIIYTLSGRFFSAGVYK